MGEIPAAASAIQISLVFMQNPPLRFLGARGGFWIEIVCLLFVMIAGHWGQFKLLFSTGLLSDD